MTHREGLHALRIWTSINVVSVLCPFTPEPEGVRREATSMHIDMHIAVAIATTVVLVLVLHTQLMQGLS